jgi:L-2-hydroxyglutarate oxidase LhgO
MAFFTILRKRCNKLDEVQVTIIGAGVVGLAVAARLSTRNKNIVVVERHDSFGRETSSRNSEVIHSGIYYPEGSLKTNLCIEGARLLYELCGRHGIPHKKLGKCIVARDQSELPRLERLFNNGKRNAVSSIHMLEKSELVTRGIHVQAYAAIYLPETGIIDSHFLMRYFARFAQENGVTLAYNSKVTALLPRSNGFDVCVEQDNYKFSSRLVINCTGLYSDAIASLAGIDIAKNSYRLHWCKGSYFSYNKRYPLPMLVYPVPEHELTGLGVHATLDMGGRLRFGPDTEYVDEIDYRVDATKKDAFFSSASRLFPDLDKDAFAPDMAGVRPKLSGPGEKVRDFVITDESSNGLPGLIDLIGIESPGLTASPAIARMVVDMALARLE